MAFEPWCIEHFSFADSLDSYGSQLTVRAFDKKVDKVSFQYVPDNYDAYILHGNSGKVLDINREVGAIYLSGFHDGELGLDSLIIGHQASIDFDIENDYSAKVIDISLCHKVIDVGKNIDIIITREYNGEVIDTIKINNSDPRVLRDGYSSFMFGNWIFTSDVSASVIGLCRYKLIHKQGTAEFAHVI